jgi:phosphoribosylglycinamide formyltransferase-1
MKRVAIFASGAGSNAEQLILRFKNSSSIQVSLIVCNKPEAGVLNIAKQHNIDTLLIDKETFFRGDSYLPLFEALKIDWIILAGFLWKIPATLIAHWPQRIINIHPALLPKYGGKGMFGTRVHQAVLEAGEKESGITIHFVDEHYDHGTTVFQATCQVKPTDTVESLSQRIHALEHKHYPKVVEELLTNML